jgi:hypothetical protein
MTYAELAPEFEVSGESEWLDAIGFAARERERSEERRDKAEAARRIGLPDSLAEELISLPEADRAEVFIEMAALLRQHRLQQITAGVPEFPERESPDPERRAQRLVEQAKQLPRKVFESKQRQLRKRDVAVDERTRTYLRDLYTNDQGQLICQVCQQEMPFRLPNGEHYFEAVECVPSFDYECWPNHLALCPTCAAKYLYANGSDFDALMSAITTTNDLILAVVLAGAPCSVRFVRDHQSDLAVVLKSAS